MVLKEVTCGQELWLPRPEDVPCAGSTGDEVVILTFLHLQGLCLFCVSRSPTSGRVLPRSLALEFGCWVKGRMRC